MGLSGAPSQPTTALSRPLRFAVARTATFDRPSPSLRVQRHGKGRQRRVRIFAGSGRRAIRQSSRPQKHYSSSSRYECRFICLPLHLPYSASWYRRMHTDFRCNCKVCTLSDLRANTFQIMQLLGVALLEEVNTPQTAARSSSVHSQTLCQWSTFKVSKSQLPTADSIPRY